MYEVIEFILRFFASVHRALPALMALAGGLGHDSRDAKLRQQLRGQLLVVFSEAGSVAGSAQADRNLNIGTCRGDLARETAERFEGM
eukprot:659088-Alexandrium_andersonii.AAC.1